jgi:hypothetical protein
MSFLHKIISTSYSSEILRKMSINTLYFPQRTLWHTKRDKPKRGTPLACKRRKNSELGMKLYAGPLFGLHFHVSGIGFCAH